jgi:hypothetical protein
MDFLDEARIAYEGSWSFNVLWDWNGFRIKLLLVDEYTDDAEEVAKCCIKIFKEYVHEGKSCHIDVTERYFLFPAGQERKIIRPTLDNIREVMRILEENLADEEPFD